MRVVVRLGVGQIGVPALRDRSEWRGHRADLVRAPDGNAHALVLDLDLADTGLLHDLDELANALGAGGIDIAEQQRCLAGVALADRLQQRLRLLTEHCEQDEIFLAGREPLGRLPHVVHARGILVEARRRFR